MASISWWISLMLLALIHEESAEDDSVQTSNDLLESQYGSIQHAAVIFRHGDRTPVRSYPLDPHKNYPWSKGLGQLTNEGKRRMFDLGKWFKIRYSKLIGETYKPELIFVHSQDIDRAIMSAQCFLFGFYPANGSDIWQDNEAWQPIPEHTIPLEYDNMIHAGRNRCRRLKQITQASYNNPKVVKVFKDHRDTMQYIETHTGINITNITNAQIVSILRTLSVTLSIEKQNNLTLPNWTRRVYPEPMGTVIRETIHSEVYDPIGKRLIAGPMLKSITSDMIEKTKNTTFLQNLHFYSGTDSTLETVMIALNIYNHIRPYFGSALIFELRKKNNDSLVTISYKNTTGKAPYLLTVPGCEPLCTLEKFLRLTKLVIPEDWSEECKIPSSFSATLIPNNWCLILITIIFIYR